MGRSGNNRTDCLFREFLLALSVLVIILDVRQSFVEVDGRCVLFCSEIRMQSGGKRSCALKWYNLRIIVWNLFFTTALLELRLLFRTSRGYFCFVNHKFVIFRI